jgi:hypothetical protein
MESTISWRNIKVDDRYEIHLFTDECTEEHGLAVIDLTESDNIDDLCFDIEEFVNSYYDLPYQIKNDDDQLGIIVDIWNTKDELVDTATFWFDDYRVDLE